MEQEPVRKVIGDYALLLSEVDFANLVRRVENMCHSREQAGWAAARRLEGEVRKMKEMFNRKEKP